MNAKLAKAMRRQARASTVGRPLRWLMTGVGSLSQSLVNDPNTFRGAYRLLKKACR